MIDLLKSAFTGGELLSMLGLLFLIGYFIFKEWPDFKKRVSSGPVKDEQDKAVEHALESRLEGIEERLSRIENLFTDVTAKLARDYQRINEIEKMQKKHERTQDDSQEELEVIMRALLGVLRGMQEQGTNGPTKTAEAELQDYLNRKAHKQEEE